MRRQKYIRTAAAAVLFSLLILPLQQMLVKKEAAKGAAVSPAPDFPADAWCDSALCGNAGAVMKMVMHHLKNNSPELAEAWLKYGCMELQAPSVMLFYGDWLTQRGAVRRAGFFYRLALKKARQNGAPQVFIRALQQRLDGGKEK